MSPINSLWFKWKSLKLPWRKSFLVGMYSLRLQPLLTNSSQVTGLTGSSFGISKGTDLAGNTFWEFRDALKAGRMRRIVKSNPKTHYADVKVSRKKHSHYPVACVEDDAGMAIGVCHYVRLTLSVFTLSPMASVAPIRARTGSHN
jgi:hypothetical protein